MANTKPRSAEERSLEMTDLVERLRKWIDDDDVTDLLGEAADYITYLEGKQETDRVNWIDLFGKFDKQKDRIEALEKEVEREHGINRPLVSELETFRSQLAEKDKEIVFWSHHAGTAIALRSERDALVKALKEIADSAVDECLGDYSHAKIARAAIGGEE